MSAPAGTTRLGHLLGPHGVQGGLKLYVLGDPPASVVAFAAARPGVNVLEVGDKMSRRGWHLNALSNPAAVHIAATVRPVLGRAPKTPA